MMVNVFDRVLGLEFRMGVGFDVEAVESKPVWVHNSITEETSAMPFDGLVVLLPFMIITFGYVYTIED
jgi:hypothetical protein